MVALVLLGGFACADGRSDQRSGAGMGAVDDGGPARIARPGWTR